MTDTIAQVRGLLATPAEVERPWRLLAAAALAAFAAVLMAGVVVLGPGIRFEEPTPGIAAPQAQP